MKIIQIAVSSMPAVANHHDSQETLFALTDEGKIYLLPYPSNFEYSTWKEVKLPEEV
jgi:hypothetical protein